MVAMTGELEFAPYEQLRDQVEVLNGRDRGLRDGKVLSISDWQRECINKMLGGYSIPPVHWDHVQVKHGSAADELARVLEAYAALVRKGIKRFQP